MVITGKRSGVWCRREVALCVGGREGVGECGVARGVSLGKTRSGLRLLRAST